MVAENTKNDESLASRRTSVLGVMIFIAVSMALLGLFANALLSEEVDPQVYSTIAFSFGVVGALVARNNGKSAILWFIVAFVVLGALSAFLIGFIRVWMGD